MITIREFSPFDLAAMNLQPRQEHMGAGATDISYAISLASNGESFSIVDGDCVLGCLGTTDFWPGRKYIWAFLSGDIGPHMLQVTRAIRKWIQKDDTVRLETAVQCDFPQAIRWAEMIGFKREGIMRKYLPAPESTDCYLYSIVR